jgi:ketosteroid isomerase-like protein
LLARAGWRLYQELPPRSRVRRTITRRVVQRGFDATNRRDFKTAFALYRPDVESVLPPELVAVGFEPVYRDREARIEAQRRWVAAWDDLRFQLDELIDLGARLVVVTRMKGTGLSSGATSEVDCVFIYTISAGRVVREQVYFNRADAFKAVGLPG